MIHPERKAENAKNESINYEYSKTDVTEVSKMTCCANDVDVKSLQVRWQDSMLKATGPKDLPKLKKMFDFRTFPDFPGKVIFAHFLCIELTFPAVFLKQEYLWA